MAQQMNGRPNGNQTPFGYTPPNSQFPQPTSMPSQYQTSGMTYSSPVYQQPQMPSIPGRVVYDVKDITPNEVPSDGTIGVFPTNDRTRVYVLYWDGLNGIKYDTYILQNPTQTETSQQTDEMAAIKDQLDRIEKHLTKLTKAIYSKPKTDQNGSK